ncbi:hypothetical protein ACE04B_28045, partial [Rhizobium phaseoli]
MAKSPAATSSNDELPFATEEPVADERSFFGGPPQNPTAPNARAALPDSLSGPEHYHGHRE